MKRFDSISVVLVIIGLLCLIQAASAAITYETVKNWDVTYGYILSEKEIRQGDSLYPGKGPVFMVKIGTIAYGYKVESSTYRGVGYKKGVDTGLYGNAIQVYYNPDNPEQSTIDISFDWAYFLTWMLLGVAVFSLEYFWYKLRVKYRPRKPFRKKVL